MIAMTYELAHAAGWDAANRSMRKAGRTVWNKDDYDVACETMNRLLGDPEARSNRVDVSDAAVPCEVAR
jgi:hypothetical protein